jgi:hypothetical protein
LPPAHATNLGSLSRKKPPLAKLRLRLRSFLCAGRAIGTASLQAVRRSELVGLDVVDLGFEPEGVVLMMRRSKTDRDYDG